jgi:hypothetical protein
MYACQRSIKIFFIINYLIIVLIGLIANINKAKKTFNNGSLGSGIDEERSEMR